LLTVRLSARAPGSFLARMTFVDELASPAERVEWTADPDTLRQRVDRWLTDTAARISESAPPGPSPRPG
jgi:hypothetical protein